MCSVRVTEPTAASGGGRKAEEGKVTSNQEGLQPVAECDDNFSGAEGWAYRAHLLRKRVPPSGPTAYAATLAVLVTFATKSNIYGTLKSVPYSNPSVTARL